MKKIILLEFNELSPALLDKWMAAGRLPNFKKFYDSSTVYVSAPDVDDSLYLEPWIQWYSLHVGLGYDEHKVFHLTDGAKASHLDIWTHLKNNGKKVASFASMNNKSFHGEGHLYLPDPWSTTETVYPPELDIYQHFIASNVQEYTNEDKGFTLGEYFNFVSFMVMNGLGIATIIKIIKQLACEKLIDKKLHWKRVALLDRIQLDLFRCHYKKGDFDFTTFFSNSTAHLQHAYWRFMEPHTFDIEPSEDEVATYGEAVFFGYQNMDAMIGEIMDFIEDDTQVILSSALSQQPYLKREDVGGQNFYRPHDVDKLLEDMGIRPSHVLPTMTHQYMLRFEDKIEADRARQKLLSWSYDDKPVFGVNMRGDENCIYFCNEISGLVDPDETITDHYNGKKVKYSKYFYRINEIKSGCHHPDGVLWFRTGNHKIMNDKASILDVFPTISEALGVQIPIEVSGRGRSLVSELGGLILQ